MDLIICVLGLLALIVEGIRCQGVYGECVQFISPQTKCDHDLVKHQLLINQHLLFFFGESQDPVIKRKKKKKKHFKCDKGDRPGLNVMSE